MTDEFSGGFWRGGGEGRPCGAEISSILIWAVGMQVYTYVTSIIKMCTLYLKCIILPSKRPPIFRKQLSFVEKMEVPYPNSHLPLGCLPIAQVQCSRRRLTHALAKGSYCLSIKSPGQCSGAARRWRGGRQTAVCCMQTCPEVDGVLALDLPQGE